MTKKSGVWIELGGPSEPRKKHRYQDMPWVLEGDDHKNFSDMRLYEIEVMFRDWLFKMQQHPDWRKRKWNVGFRRTSKSVCESLGIDTSKVSSDWRYVTTLCKYYAVTTKKDPSVVKDGAKTKSGKQRAKRLAHTGYVFPYTEFKRPFSLRLRWEMMEKTGEITTLKEFRKSDRLLAGNDSRFKRTRDAQERRRKIAQQRWQEHNGGKYPGRWDHDGFPSTIEDTDIHGKDA